MKILSNTNTNKDITAKNQIISEAANGTPPLVVSSDTLVLNLNADKLDGKDASAFYLASNPSGYTTNTGTVISVGGTGTVAGLTLTGTVTTSGNLTLGGTLLVPVASGGTNITPYAAGDILYASAINVLSKLAKGTDGTFLKLVNGLPSWAASSDTNYYPTAFVWTAGTTAGPTGSLTGVGMSAVAYGAIPSASATASGIVTTGAQSFGGEKTFAESIKIGTGTKVWETVPSASTIAWKDGSDTVRMSLSNTGILDVAIKDQNDASAIKFWTGTQAQYDAIGTPSADVVYFITE